MGYKKRIIFIRGSTEEEIKEKRTEARNGKLGRYFGLREKRALGHRENSTDPVIRERKFRWEEDNITNTG